MIRPLEPPRLAMAVLQAALPKELAQALLGDLVEEAGARSEHGPGAARRWLYVQLTRSIPALFLLALRRAHPHVVAAAALGSACAGGAAFGVFRALWSEVLFLVPLRAGHDPTAGWLVFGAALVTASSALGAVLGALGARFVAWGRNR